MRQLKIGNRTLTDANIFIIAEIGSNHGGDFNLAKRMVVEAAKCGVDAVKFQKRDNSRMFTKAMLAKPYCNEFSLGATYGEHREKLDWFGEKEFKELDILARRNHVVMFATPMEEESADFLYRLDMPIYKIGSNDITNIPLIKHIAKFEKPMLISTGGADAMDIERAYRTVTLHHNNVCIMHCISTYPNRDEDLNLSQIMELKRRYENILIGFSSHHSSIEPVKEAYFCGARVFEVHFTLNRGSRGTDHGFSLEPRGLSKLCEDIKRIKVRLGNKERRVSEQEAMGFVYKMGKAVHPARTIQAGAIIGEGDLVIKAPADGLKPYEMENVVGRVAIHDISTGDILTREDFE